MFKSLIQSLTGKPARSASTKVARDVGTSSAGNRPGELITVYDVHGRQIQITRGDWRDNVLLPQLKERWNEPDAIYQLIVDGLNDGFHEELERASGRLVDIDPIVERSHVIRTIVLMKLERFDEAERVLRDAIARTGESGTILTNLAKIQVSRGDIELADATLWKAITLDPNQDNGLGWWAARERDRGGDAAYVAALQRAAALPGSWRANLWLGRAKLAEGDADGAIALFQRVLAQGTFDHDTLVTISGDLGNAGLVQEFVELVSPHYDPMQHAPQAGFNLLQAYLQLGYLDQGEELLGRLYTLNMPPFKQHLDEMAMRYQERRRETTPPRPVAEESLEIGQFPFDRPVWMYGLRDPDWLLPNKPADAKKVMFLMLGKSMSGKQQAEEQREDDIGRLSRAIPLYLAESAYEWTPVHAQSLVAVVMGGGPVIFGAHGEDAERATAMQLIHLAELVVQGSIAQEGDRWLVTISLRETSQGELVATETVSADNSGIEAAVLDLEGKLLAHLGGAQVRPHDRIYTRPTLEQMQPYLNALAQSLMLGLVANEIVSRDSMWGERNMLEWPLRMALHWPDYTVPKAMYVSGISHASRYRSMVLEEFDERSFALLRDMHAAKSPIADLGPLLLHAYRRTEGLAAIKKNTSDMRRLEWLKRVGA